MSWYELLWVYLFVVQWLRHVLLFATPRTAVHQASLSFTVSLSMLKLMSIESMDHPIWSLKIWNLDVYVFCQIWEISALLL